MESPKGKAAGAAQEKTRGKEGENQAKKIKEDSHINQVLLTKYCETLKFSTQSNISVDLLMFSS